MAFTIAATKILRADANLSLLIEQMLPHEVVSVYDNGNPIYAVSYQGAFDAPTEAAIATIIGNHDKQSQSAEQIEQENIETKTTAAADFSQYAVFDAYVLDKAIAIHSRAVMLVAISAYLNLIKTAFNAMLAALKILSPVNFGAIDPLPDFQLPPLSEVRDAVDNDLGV